MSDDIFAIEARLRAAEARIHRLEKSLLGDPCRERKGGPVSPPRYLVSAGNTTPDEYTDFDDALEAYRRAPLGARLWRNDESDDGEHLDGLTAEERLSADGDEDPRVMAAEYAADLAYDRARDDELMGVGQ